MRAPAGPRSAPAPAGPAPAAPVPAAGTRAPSPAAALLHLQRTLGNRAVTRMIQRDIRATGTTDAGTLSLDFAKHDALSSLGRASEKGVISFLPGDAAPDTGRIHLEQLAKTEGGPQDQLPDLDDFALQSQATTGKGGAEAGFFVDQVVPELREKVTGLIGPVYLGSGERHAYAHTGDAPTVGLGVVIAAIGAGKKPRQIQAETGISRAQLQRIHDWIGWARDEGFLGPSLAPDDLARAMVRTVAKKDVDDHDLWSATGIDARIWSGIRLLVQRERKAQREVDVDALARESQAAGAGLTQVSPGYKRGDLRHPASLYDTPGSKHPLRFTFKTAPIDVTTGQDLGMHAEWGFEVERVQNVPRVRDGSEHGRIVGTQGSSYRATAAEARERFDTYWQREREWALNPPLPPPLPSHLAPPQPQSSQPQSTPPQSQQQQQPQRRSLLLQVTAYREGQQGVFFLQDETGPLVAKPLKSAYNEAYALELAELIGVPQPKTRIIALNADNSHGAWAREVVGEIRRSRFAGEYTRVFGKQAPPFLMVMEKVEGLSLDEAHEREVDYGDPGPLLADYGLMAAFDLLLFYRDRTSSVGAGNLGNVMLTRGGGGALRGLAIDQRVNVTVKEKPFGQKPLDEIARRLGKIQEGDPELLGYLWDDLPGGMQKALGGQKKGLPRLRAAVLDGLRRVAERLKPEMFEELAKRLSGLRRDSSSLLEAQADDVDVAALQQALTLIQKLAG